MPEVAIPLFISVEQIANAIKQMTKDELVRLFELVPSLHNGEVSQTSDQVDTQITRTTERVRAELMKAPSYQPITGDEPFHDGFTLNEYIALPESKQAQLWDEWEGSLEDLEEVELTGTQSHNAEAVSDAMPA